MSPTEHAPDPAAVYAALKTFTPGDIYAAAWDIIESVVELGDHNTAARCIDRADVEGLWHTLGRARELIRLAYLLDQPRAAGLIAGMGSAGGAK